MRNGSLFFVILGMALVTVLPRVLPLLLIRRKMPPLLERWLTLIAPAILAALLAPELLLDRTTTPATLHLEGSNIYLLASLPTFFVAWTTRSLFGTVAAGLLAVALLRAAGVGA